MGGEGAIELFLSSSIIVTRRICVSASGIDTSYSVCAPKPLRARSVLMR